ncbi:TonB-dependent siderophore receptor [Steroidobacter sp.]|uniref:TonB-dependent siderophore receptor n=1 Tax=Steroidobacter sp. TaxID=1978227 RepID=UPI001A427CB0|nr:TonB-dependent siderophore receptor [Steroidobacter sp.]MBL8265822.1 TonB-dependent siderophore receptor [Steroidobacter sp.]
MKTRHALRGAVGSLYATVAMAHAAADTELEEVVVRATQFKYEEAQSALKMPLSLKDTPQTVKVITQDLLDFASIANFEDVYKVDASGGVSHARDGFPRNYYRGFLQQGINAIKVDGFRMTANINLDLSPFERFEVVKGATSTLYGQNSVSGTLNAISKAPTDAFGAQFDLQAGSYQHRRVQGDVHGPIDDDGRLSYRIVGAAQEEDSYMDVDGSRLKALAPTLKYQIGENTSVTTRVIYQDYTYAPSFGYGAQFIGTDSSDPNQLVSSNFVVPRTPRDRSGGAPWNRTEKEATFAQGVLEHRFQNDWQLRGNVQYQKVKGRADAFQTWNTDETGETFSYLYGRDQENEVYAAEVNLFGDVELFGRKHTLFFGADYAELDTDTMDVGENGPTGFNIMSPDWASVSVHRFPTDYDYFFGSENRREISGVTAQVLARPVDGLTVSVGARYSRDITRNRLRSGDIADYQDYSVAPFGTWSELKANEVTMQGGVTYALTPQLNVYASYGETFEPRGGRLFGAGLAGPEEGKAYEVGLKGDALNRRLSYSVAAFDMRRTNIQQRDPAHPGFVLPLGTQRSRGVEVDFQGTLLPGWEVFGSLAYLDAEFIEGQYQGFKSANGPDFGLSLFTSYQIQEGALRGAGVGAGVVRKSGMETFDAAGYGRPIAFDLGGFTEVDLRVFYDRERWRYEIAATNLLDTKYYSSYSEAMWFGLQVNPPRRVIGSVSYRW